MQVSENLRKLRISRTKYSQRELAELLGVETNTYANWESGINDVKSQYIPKLADIFNVEIKDLFDNKPAKIEINQTHNEGKDNSVLNGAIIILTNKESIDKLVDILKEKV